MGQERSDQGFRKVRAAVSMTAWENGRKRTTGTEKVYTHAGRKKNKTGEGYGRKGKKGGSDRGVKVFGGGRVWGESGFGCDMAACEPSSMFGCSVAVVDSMQ